MIGRLFRGRIHSGRYPCNIIVCIKHSYRNEVIVNSMDKLIRKIFGQCSGKNNFLYNKFVILFVPVDPR